MQKILRRRQFAQEDAAKFKGLPPLLQRIYAARHVSHSAELERGLQALLPYHSLLNIDKAAEIIANAVMQQKKIMIVGDFDADGATSTAVAIKALRGFGARDAIFLVPNRFSFGYGLTPELVNEAKNFEPALIITVDNGIANHAGVAAAKALGMQVVVTDHHLQAATLPEADAIVNPNQQHDLFPSKNLAGVGVIFYVMLAVRQKLTTHDWFTRQQLPVPNMSRLLDIVALGTVADLVPLDANNRVLVHQGLLRIRSLQCAPGIIGLLELAGRDATKCVARDLGFAVAARLNAAGRLDDMSLGISCLLSDDAAEARNLARKLDELNVERRSIEKDMHAQAIQTLEKVQISQDELPLGLCLYDDHWHQGVIGILASRVKERYHRPVIVFAPGNDGELKGSARSISGLHIRDILALMAAEHPELIKKFGGHAMAAGLSIAKELLEDFSRIFAATVSNHLTEADLEHVVFTDGNLAFEEFNLDSAELIQQSGPWGQQFPEPLFEGEFKIIEQRIVGSKHLKLRLQLHEQLYEAIAFFVDLSAWPNHRCNKIRCAFRLDVNEFKGKRKLQLIIEYFEEAPE